MESKLSGRKISTEEGGERGEEGSGTIRDPQNLAVETPPAPPGSNQSFHLPTRSLFLPFFSFIFRLARWTSTSRGRRIDEEG